MPKMKLEQKIVAIYTVIGFAGGLISNYLTASSIFLALLVPYVIYFVCVLPLVKKVKDKKMKKIVFNSLFTFFLVWLTVWIFFYNL